MIHHDDHSHTTLGDFHDCLAQRRRLYQAQVWVVALVCLFTALVMVLR